MRECVQGPRPVDRFVGLSVGTVLGAVGAALMKRGGFGLTSFYSVSLCLYEVTGCLTRGGWNAVFQLVLILTLILIRRQFAPRYLLSFAVAWVQSVMIDLFDLLCAVIPDGWEARMLSYVGGFGIMSAGIAVLAVCGLPVAPMNLFVRELAENLGQSFHKVKTMFDLTCLVLAAGMSLCAVDGLVGIGWGTLAATVLTGPLTGLYLRWLSERVVFCSRKPEDRVR